MTQKTITTAIDANATVFTPEQAEELKQSAADVAKGDMFKEDGLESFFGILDKAPTFDMWVHAQKLFQAGYYITQPAIEVETLQKRTTRFFNELIQTYGVIRPKSDDPAAEKKAAQREKAKADLLKKYKGKTPEDLRAMKAEAHKTLAKGENAEAKKQVAEVEKVLKLQTETETKKEKADLKAIRDDIIARVRQAAMPKLTAVLALLK